MKRRTALLIDGALTVAAFGLGAIAAWLIPLERTLFIWVLGLALLAASMACTEVAFVLAIYLLVSEPPRPG